MSTAQRLIKYGAIAFATILIVNIVGAIYFGLSVFSGVLGLSSTRKVTELHDLEVNQKGISILKLDLLSTNVTIKKGDTLKVETNSDNITLKERENGLLIKEKEYHWHIRNKQKDVVVYLPETLFDEVMIETGAGKIMIEELNTKKIDFDLGAGKVEIEKLNVSDEAIFNGGAGEVTVLSGSLHDLDLDLGVGRFFLCSSLTGTTKIDAGVGEVDLNLLGKKEDYRVKISKGIGSVHLDGQSMKDDTTYGTGKNSIEIDGGIGSISLTFKK